MLEIILKDHMSRTELLLIKIVLKDNTGLAKSK